MKGFRRFLLLMLTLVLLCGTTVYGVSSGSESLPISTWEFEVLRLVNKERVAQKLDPVTTFDAIQSACDVRATEIDGYFSHTRPDGTRCFTALKEAGVDYCYAGENIAYGYHSPAAVMAGWMNSEGHRANILTPEFTHMGVGYDYISSHNWVQMFCSLWDESYTSATIVVPGTAEVGTEIDEMYIFAVLENSACGKCYLPIMSEFVTGYDPSTLGTQTCQATFLGFRCSFEITLTDPCADGHSYEAVTTAPTCTEQGYTTYTCTRCGDGYVGSYTDPTGHSFTPAAGMDPTCTEAGYVEYACCLCWDLSVSYQVTVPATGHRYESDVTAPTCTERGYTTHTCTNCGDRYVDTYTDAIGHSYGSWTVTKEPTCTAAGTQSRSCARCCRVEEMSVPVVDHSFVPAAGEDPTCTGDGYTEYACCLCWNPNLSYQETIPATGHSFVPAAGEYPTCTRDGYVEYACCLCWDPDVSYQETVPATGHSYGDDGICTACQDVRLAITAQPVGQKVKSGTTATFTVTAQGEGLTYQWQYRTSSSGAWKSCTGTGNKTAKLTFRATTGLSSRQYRCKITDCSGATVTTRTVYLYVLGIKTQPTGQKVKAGTTVKFTVAATGHNKTYQWQYKTANGNWTNCTGQGNKTATLSFRATAAMSGRQYRCVVRDSAGNTVTTKAVYLYVLGIRTQPTAKTAAAGSTVKFTVNAAGHNKTYQWQYKNASGNWVNATGAGNKTATLKITAKTAFNGRQYRCIIKDSAGNQVITKTVKLTVN